MMTKDEFLSKFETSTLSDSGNRTKFDSGAVRDMHEGKGRCDLMPLDVIANLFRPYPAELDQSEHAVYYSFDDSLTYNVLSDIYKFQTSGNVNHLYSLLNEYLAAYSDTIYSEFDALLDLAKHYENGARKYGEHNWEKGIPLHSFIDSAIRHYFKHRREDNDEPHNVAFIWNVIGAIWTKQHRPELDDFCIKE